MADIQVSSESLTGVSNQLSSGAQEIESQLSNLKSLVTGLTSGEWQGEASLSFQELFEQWDQAGQQLKESLIGISEQLARAALAYEESETGVSGGFRG